MKRLFVGIDPSLTSTGLYMYYNETGKEIRNYVQIDTKRSMFPSSINRCLYIADIVSTLILEQPVDQIGLVVCQDYFVGRQQGVVIQLAELGTLIRYKLLLKDLPLCVVSPKTNKKFVTTNGNAKKEQMIKQVESRWNFKASTDNLADACGMAHLAQFIYNIWNNNIQLNKQDAKTYAKYLTKDCLIKL